MMECYRCGREGRASFYRVEGVPGVRCSNYVACSRRVAAALVPKHRFPVPTSPDSGSKGDR